MNILKILHECNIGGMIKRHGCPIIEWFIVLWFQLIVVEFTLLILFSWKHLNTDDTRVSLILDWWSILINICSKLTLWKYVHPLTLWIVWLQIYFLYSMQLIPRLLSIFIGVFFLFVIFTCFINLMARLNNLCLSKLLLVAVPVVSNIINNYTTSQFKMLF